MASMGVVNVSTVVGYKITKTVSQTQLLRTIHVVPRAPKTVSETQLWRTTHVVPGAPETQLWRTTHVVPRAPETQLWRTTHVVPGAPETQLWRTTHVVPRAPKTVSETAMENNSRCFPSPPWTRSLVTSAAAWLLNMCIFQRPSQPPWSHQGQTFPSIADKNLTRSSCHTPPHV